MTLSGLIRIFTGAVLLELTCLVYAANGAHGAPLKTMPIVVPATQHVVHVGMVDLHYSDFGEGDPVLLLPGWPEDGYAWRKVAPRLAATGRRVIILDPRGFGDSDKPRDGYDLDIVATEIHAFLLATGLDRRGGIDVVTHDLGGWIGYALASAYPDDVRRLVLSEVTIPRPDQPRPLPDDSANIKTWHFAFNRLPGLPEMLVTGHERAFLDWLFDEKARRPAAIDMKARAEYTRVFATLGGAHAGFEYYRDLFSNGGLQRMKERLSNPLPMPVLAIGADGGVGSLLTESMRGAATDLHSVVLQNCGHYLPEECPAEFAGAVSGFWGQTATTQR
ncbi:alpha/beta fold hydrolase [Glacieibacterium megasporae]|uniref:alpha/beta fold hydrolase n=1 Tax=Glacieibacterium megasporae TaxID=2835787 RepID=UPI001C1E0A26|nr:alpha/beta hydrolase [Polymorphobacter megasporae]UAJ10582.1 alpha/beta hydrolase [Polymorphobacter megasporae]